MNDKRRYVADTNILVSAAIFDGSVPWRAVEWIVLNGALLFSPDTADEVHEVLARPKFDRYVPGLIRRRFLQRLMAVGQTVLPTEQIAACRDPKDDKFLAVAVVGGAECIVTGDADLLALNPYRSIRIVTAAAFLQKRESTADHPHADA